MERKIGEIFTWNGVELTVVIYNGYAGCCNCYFNSNDCYDHIGVIGFCYFSQRADGLSVIFVENE